MSRPDVGPSLLGSSEGNMGEWQLVHRRDEEGLPIEYGSLSEPEQNNKRRFHLHNIFLNTKSRLYNLYRPLSSSIPEFSSGPLYLLGVSYAPPQSLKEAKLDASVSDSSLGPDDGKKMTNGDLGNGGGGGWLGLKQDFLQSLQRGWSLTPDPKKECQSNDTRHIQKFLHDFASRIWLTYRMQFPPIEPETYTTDMGWGCMLRTGQMMLAQAFICHYLGRGWRVQGGKHLSVYRQILRWFADDPSAPYSLHAIAQTAHKKYNKRIGEWFEPTTIALTIKDLVHQHTLDGLRIYVPQDGAVYRRDIEAICHYKDAPFPCPFSIDMDGSGQLNNSSCGSPLAHSWQIVDNGDGETGEIGLSSSGINNTEKETGKEKEKDKEKEKEKEKKPIDRWHPVIILIPIRLGIERLNPIYLRPLKRLFTFPQSLGIVGGKPQSSYYFVGCQDGLVFYLDPHIVNNCIENMESESFPTESFHTDIPQAMLLSDIDPSLVVGFYIKDRADFEDWMVRITEMLEEEECLFSVVDNDITYPSVESDLKKSVAHELQDDDEVVWL